MATNTAFGQTHYTFVLFKTHMHKMQVMLSRTTKLSSKCKVQHSITQISISTHIVSTMKKCPKSIQKLLFSYSQ